MVDLSAVLVANGLGAALMVTLLLSDREVPHNVFLDDKIFSAMCQLTLCLCVIETAAFWVDGKTFAGAIACSRILNVLLFVANSAFAFLWTVYVDYKLFGQEARLRRFGPLLALPAVVVLVMSVLNLWMDVFFTISAENIYTRTTLMILPYIVTYGYLIYGAVMVLRYQNKVGKYLFMPVMVFLLPVFVGSLLQMLFYGIALTWVSVAFGLTALYINLQNEVSLLDPLTKLYNRTYLNRYLNSTMQRSGMERKTAGIMLDINSFKEINDTYGHSEGDTALQLVGQCLMDTVSGANVAVRYGGDEFIIILRVREEREVEQMMERIRMRMAQISGESARPYTITLSMGTALYDPATDNLDRFLGRMDQRMYEAKRSYYSGSNNRRRRGEYREESAT